jgi:MFS family permease
MNLSEQELHAGAQRMRRFPQGTRDGVPMRAATSLLFNRIAVSAVFFMHGLTFSSWASRIPTIQESLRLSASALGGVLFGLPAGFFISLPFAGWLVARLQSKRVVVIASVLYGISLVAIGMASGAFGLFVCLFAFGFFANLLNISINTQAVAVEVLYRKKIMASFHGLWSLAGFAGAALGAWMSNRSVLPVQHFMIICVTFLVVNTACAFYLVVKDDAGEEKRPLFAMPDRTLLGLGFIAFCSMMVEGAMFDWSGLYFTQVIKVAPEITGLGYTTFMVAMAAMRFAADGLFNKVGLKRLLQASGVLATTGLLLAVVFPQMMPSLMGFFLVGMGVSSVVPMVYSAAGKSTSVSSGTALTAVSSMGFVGLLIGPPVIGFIAEATDLRISFVALSVMSVAVVILASRLQDQQPGRPSNRIGA